MNKFLINGRMCGSVDVKTTSNNKMMGNFTVAVQRKYDRDKTDFLRCTAWEKNAENIQKFFSKGDMINIIGRIEINEGEKEGIKVNYTNVIVEEWNFCGSKKDAEENKVEEEKVIVDSDLDDELPF